MARHSYLRATRERVERLEAKYHQAPRGVVYQWFDDDGYLNLVFSSAGSMPEGAEPCEPRNCQTVEDAKGRGVLL